MYTTVYVYSKYIYSDGYTYIKIFMNYELQM